MPKQQSKNLNSPKENTPKSVSEQLNIPTYPGSRLVPTGKSPKGVQILEMLSDDSWKDILSFYKEKFSEKGWQPFASNELSDRGSLSFHPTTEQTVTVLAAYENSTTHIRIYVQA